MKKLLSFISNREGASAVEFALVAPVFLMSVFGVIEYGRLLWMRQAVSEVAMAAARCAAMDSVCKTGAEIKTFAVSRAQESGIVIAVADVTPTLGTTCNGYTANRVDITLRFNSAIGQLVRGMPSAKTSSSCFPTRPTT